MKTIKQKQNPKICCIHTNHSDFLSSHTIACVFVIESTTKTKENIKKMKREKENEQRTT
jgi:hypothetical protein